MTALEYRREVERLLAEIDERSRRLRRLEARGVVVADGELDRARHRLAETLRSDR